MSCDELANDLGVYFARMQLEKALAPIRRCTHSKAFLNYKGKQNLSADDS